MCIDGAGAAGGEGGAGGVDHDASEAGSGVDNTSSATEAGLADQAADAVREALDTLAEAMSQTQSAAQKAADQLAEALASAVEQAVVGLTGDTDLARAIGDFVEEAVKQAAKAIIDESFQNYHIMAQLDFGKNIAEMGLDVTKAAVENSSLPGALKDSLKEAIDDFSAGQLDIEGTLQKTVRDLGILYGSFVERQMADIKERVATETHGILNL